MDPPAPSITVLLDRVAAGDATAEAELIEAVYTELRHMAVARMAALHPGQTLQPTALVHEAYMKLAPADSVWDGRAHFFGAAGRAMRNVIVDQVRRGATRRHGGDRMRVPLDGTIAEPLPDDPDRLLDIESALRRFERTDPRAARIVDLRFFVGLSDRETADALDISIRTVQREWAYAKAWLRRALTEGAFDDE